MATESREPTQECCGGRRRAAEEAVHALPSPEWRVVVAVGRSLLAPAVAVVAAAPCGSVEECRLCTRTEPCWSRDAGYPSSRRAHLEEEAVEGSRAAASGRT